MTKVNNLHIYKSECVMPSALTHSKVFRVIAQDNIARKKEKVEFVSVRTNAEALSYKGFILDLKQDYPLLHILLKEKQKQGSNQVLIDLNKVLKELGMQVRKENRQIIYNRIVDFCFCELSVNKYKPNKNGNYPEVVTRLVLEIRKLGDKNDFNILFPEDIDDLIADFDHQIIDLADYQKLKRQASMSIYLTMITHFFVSRSKLKISFEKLKIRYIDSQSDKQIKQELQKGFNELINTGLIKSYKPYIAKNDKEMYEIKIK